MGEKLDINGASLEWLGQSCFKIKSDRVIYIDPFKIPENSEKADLIFITHEHYDHCSIEDVNKIKKESTIIIAPQKCLTKLGIEGKTVVPHQKLEVEGIKIETTYAYNVDKEYHMKTTNNVGYVIEINGKRIYHAGDTDLIPEMNALDDIYVALLPIGGTYTMDATEAAQAANIIMP